MYLLAVVECNAGPSGHGKTEMARQLGPLLSAPHMLIDCTTHKHVTDIFGPKPPYRGFEKGSEMSDFLSKHSGQRSIVILDEFEKTDMEVWNSFLKLFEDGTKAVGSCYYCQLNRAKGTWQASCIVASC